VSMTLPELSHTTLPNPNTTQTMGDVRLKGITVETVEDDLICNETVDDVVMNINEHLDELERSSSSFHDTMNALLRSLSKTVYYPDLRVYNAVMNRLQKYGYDQNKFIKITQDNYQYYCIDHNKEHLFFLMINGGSGVVIEDDTGGNERVEFMEKTDGVLTPPSVFIVQPFQGHRFFLVYEDALVPTYVTLEPGQLSITDDKETCFCLNQNNELCTSVGEMRTTEPIHLFTY
jgi:hypothetical protein